MLSCTSQARITLTGICRFSHVWWFFLCSCIFRTNRSMRLWARRNGLSLSEKDLRPRQHSPSPNLRPKQCTHVRNAQIYRRNQGRTHSRTSDRGGRLQVRPHMHGMLRIIDLPSPILDQGPWLRLQASSRTRRLAYANVL